MILKGLLTLLTQRPEFRRLVQQIQKAEGLPALTGITETSRPFVVSALSAALKEPLLFVVADEAQALQVVDTLKAMVQSADDVIFMPDRDALPYERLISDHETTQQRMHALLRLIDGEQPGTIVVCSARALSQPIIPPRELAASLYDLEPGQEVDLTLMLEHLYNLGYEPVTEVEEPGQFSHRGGIVDLFPATLPRPVRIEFFGDEIESLRTFDPQTQRSLNPIASCVIGPAREALPLRGPEAVKVLEQLNTALLHHDAQERWQRDLEDLRYKRSFDDIAFYLPYLHETASVLDYLPRSGLLVLDNPESIQNRLLELDAQAEEMKTRFENDHENPTQLLAAHITWSQLGTRLAQLRQLRFADILSASEGEFDAYHQGGTEHLLPSFTSASSYGGRLRSFVQDCRKALDNRERVVIVSAQARRLSEVLGDESILGEHAILVSPGVNINEAPESGTLTLIQGQLPEGWQSHSLATTFFTDTEIFGWSRKYKAQQRKIITPASFLAEVNAGDYVVHQEYGIGRFEGLVKLEFDGRRTRVPAYSLCRYR